MNDAVTTAATEAEMARIAAHATAVAVIAYVEPGLAHMSSHEITMEIARRMEIPRRNWEEFAERARFEHGVVLRTLRTWRIEAEEREERWAEAARQQREAERLAVLEAEERARHAATQGEA